MRKFYFILVLMLVSIFTLSACGKEDATTDDTGQKEVVEETTDEEEGKAEKQTEDEEKTEETAEMSDPSGVTEIFIKAAEVMSTVEGMNITGEIQSTLNMMEIVENETTKITGTVSMDPFSQYLGMDSESDFDGVTKSEMYMTKDRMYMSDPDSEGWFSMSMEQAGIGNLSAMISESHIRTMADLHELFELTEDSDQYTITFEGAGEEYKKIAFGTLKDIAGEEAYQSFTNMITDISGTYEFTIDKESFHIVAMKVDTDQTMDMGFGETHSTDEIRYEYSDFNNVEQVTVPADVVENAQDLNSLLEMEVN